MATFNLSPMSRLDYRRGDGTLIATGIASEILAERNELVPVPADEALYVCGPIGGRITSVRDHSDGKPITGALLVFATLTRLAGGRIVTVEVAS